MSATLQEACYENTTAVYMALEGTNGMDSPSVLLWLDGYNILAHMMPL